MSRIVDNQTNLEDGLNHANMADIFKQYHDDAEDFKFHVGSGFFFIDGFGELYDLIDIDKLNHGPESYEKYWGTRAPIIVLMGKETNKPTKEALIDAKNMVKYALNTHEEEYLKFLECLIEKDLIKFKVFTDQRFHAKIYFFYNGKSIDDIYVGSANLTSAGLTRNIELTAPMSADKFGKKSHKEWFRQLWDRSTDNLNVLDIIKSYKKHDFIYYEPRNFFENLIKLMDKEYLFYHSDISADTLLAKFQSFDFYQVMNTLEKYNGCILASSVGLGKSYVALEVMRYIENNDMEALLIGPSNLIKGKDSTWNEYLKKYDLKVECLGYGDLQQENFDASKYIDYDLVVIDEAHNLRNDSNRRRNMMNVIKNSFKAKYLLLTATPINVHISDLVSLINLFYEVNKDKWLDKELKKKFETFKTKVNKLEKSKSDSPDVLDDVIELQEYIESELIVKSTRNMVREYFSDDLVKLAGTNEIYEPIVHRETFKYHKDYQKNVFDKLPDFLVSLNYEHSKFQKVEESYEYHEDKNLIYLYKWVLYKRAESSIYAFYTSIKKLRDRINFYINYLTNVMSLNDLGYKIEPGLEERLKIASIVYNNLETEEEKENIIKNLRDDVIKITEMLDELEKFKKGYVFKHNNKLKRLKEILTECGENKKCLIFTEYFATLEYLYRNLNEEFSIDYVAGDDLKGQSMKPSLKERKIKKFKENKFQHLVSTDVLAEGFNLPEADIVINYDLPYNPVKIIQRIGRATRINVPKQIEIRNFQPDEGIDQELNLIEKLDMRISNIISMIGIDYSIWTDTEHLVKEKEKKDQINKCRVLKELKNLIGTKNPEEIYQVHIKEESKLDILLRKSIEHYNLQQEDIPVRKPTKPIYTTLIDNKNGFYGIYKLKNDFFEFGESANFIEEPSRPLKTYDNKKIIEFCDIIKTKYQQIMWKKRDQAISNQKDKEIINKLETIRKEVPPLSNIIKRIFECQLQMNFQIFTIITDEIYPTIKNDDFIWITQQDLLEKWEEKLNEILENEGAEEIHYLDETLKKPEAYKEMISAFIQFKEAGSDD